MYINILKIIHYIELKQKENRVCTGNYYYSLSESELFSCSLILSIPINEMINEKHSNPLNLIDIYFQDKKRACDDDRCKNGIIVLIFLIDSLDVNTLKKNNIRIRKLFNNLLILNSEAYYIKEYYLMPYENYFIILFQSENTDDNLKSGI